MLCSFDGGPRLTFNSPQPKAKWPWEKPERQHQAAPMGSRSDPALTLPFTTQPGHCHHRWPVCKSASFALRKLNYMPPIVCPWWVFFKTRGVSDEAAILIKAFYQLRCLIFEWQSYSFFSNKQKLLNLLFASFPPSLLPVYELTGEVWN